MKKLITNITTILLFTFIFAVATTQTVHANTTESCAGVNVDIKGFGAGLMYQARPVTIAGEHPVVASIPNKCAVITWVTDMPSTSQVVFEEADKVSSIDATKPNFGYSFASTQNNGADVVHKSIINGLTPGKTYIYRVVSRSHPSAMPTVSEAHAITIPNIVITKVEIKTVNKKTAHKNTNLRTWNPVNTTKTTPDEEVATDSNDENSITASDLLYNDTDKEDGGATTTASSTGIGSVPSALTAVSGKNIWQKIKGSSFIQRILKAFSFSKDQDENNKEDTDKTTDSDQANQKNDESNEEVTPIVANGIYTTVGTPPSIPTETKEALTKTTKTVVARTGFLIPTLFILLFIYLLQQVALPMLGIIVDRPRIFWMFSTLLIAVASALMGYYKITLVMIAIFLGLFSWYLFKEATKELKAEEDTTNTKSKIDNSYAEA